MADINAIGLPAGLPELAGTGSPLSVGGSACFCSGKCRIPPFQCPANPCRYDIAARQPPDRIKWVPDSNQVQRLLDIQAAAAKPPEMTAADLGLRTPDFVDQHDTEWFYASEPFHPGHTSDCQCFDCRAAFYQLRADRHLRTDAPYSFWLGAAHG